MTLHTKIVYLIYCNLKTNWIYQRFAEKRYSKEAEHPTYYIYSYYCINTEHTEDMYKRTHVYMDTMERSDRTEGVNS